VLCPKFRTYHGLVVEIRSRLKSEDGVKKSCLQAHEVGHIRRSGDLETLSFDRCLRYRGFGRRVWANNENHFFGEKE